MAPSEPFLFLTGNDYESYDSFGFSQLIEMNLEKLFSSAKFYIWRINYGKLRSIWLSSPDSAVLIIRIETRTWIESHHELFNFFPRISFDIWHLQQHNSIYHASRLRSSFNIISTISHRSLIRNRKEKNNLFKSHKIVIILLINSVESSNDSRCFAGMSFGASGHKIVPCKILANTICVSVYL